MTQTVFNYHLDVFGASSEFKQVSNYSPELKAAYAEVRKAFASATFEPLVLANGENRSNMRLSGMFGPEDVAEMYVDVIHFPPLPSDGKKPQET